LDTSLPKWTPAHGLTYPSARAGVALSTTTAAAENIM
jgi:hypothetical protein